MSSQLQGILGVLSISVIPFLGLLLLVVNKDRLERYMHLLVSFAVGALLGNALLHILPELIESGMEVERISILIIIGILSFYSIEQFLNWRHTHNEQEIEHPNGVGIMNQIGDTVHNFVDGILISGAFIVNPALGWTTVFAVILHEIPQELADFGILLYSKWKISNIIIANLISSLFALLGLLIGYWLNFNVENFSNYALGITIGGFIYIACSDLIPDLHSMGGKNIKERILQLVILLLGIGVFFVL